MLPYRELINKIRSNINDDKVKAIYKEKYGIEKIDRIDFEKGDIVTHNEQVSFKLDFKISSPLSLLVDRKGNCTVFSSDNKLMPASSGEVIDDDAFSSS